MKEILLSPFFLLSVLIFLFHQFIQKILEINIVFLDNHLDCLLFSPIILSLITIERRFLTKNKSYKLSRFEIVIIPIIVSLLFEEIIPLFFTQFTKDYYDYIAYALGAFMFYSLINKNLKSTFK